MIAPKGRIHSEEPPVPTRERGNAAAWGVDPTSEVPSTGATRGVPTEDRGNEFGVTAARRFWLRVLFALDVVGAGGPGVLMLAAPDKAGDLLFGGDLTPDAATRVLGCVWVALGLLSVAGLLRPVTFSPMLLVQFGYKLIWLVAVGLPAAVAGEAVPPVLVVIFAAWVVAVGVAAPWGELFGREEPTRGSLPRKKPGISEVRGVWVRLAGGSRRALRHMPLRDVTDAS